MAMNTPTAKDIDQYIAGFPPEVQVMLEELRATIKKAAPEAMETISYQMPAFKLKESWFTLQPTKITSVSTLQGPELNTSRRRFLPINLQKVPFSFLWINRYHWI
jgi:hypothetical protein